MCDESARLNGGPTFNFCQEFAGVEPLHLLFPVFRQKLLHAGGLCWGEEKKKERDVIRASLYCNEKNIPLKIDPMVVKIRTGQTFHAPPEERKKKREKENR